MPPDACVFRNGLPVAAIPAFACFCGVCFQGCNTAAGGFRILDFDPGFRRAQTDASSGGPCGRATNCATPPEVFLTRVTVKLFCLPHCLSKLLGFSKRVKTVCVASFLNPAGIVVLIKDAKVFAITSCGYNPPELRV